MTSPLMSRMMLAFRAGLQFGGRRNLYHVYGYPVALTSPILYAKYQRQDIVSRIVNMPAEEMWTTLPELQLTGEVKTAWDLFSKRIQLRKRIVQADKMCCFGPFSIILLGLPGNLSTPAKPIKRVEQIAYASVYGGDSVRVSQYETNPTNPRFGLPLVYQIQRNQTTDGSYQFGINPAQTPQYLDVHASRVVHIVDRPVQGDLYGEPRLAQIFNVLEDLLKVVGGSAELYWILGNRGMQVDVDKDMELEPADAAALTDELDEFHHNLRRTVRTRGVKITPLGAESADPRGVFEVAISIIASATNIPQRILMGAEAGQLASEQDRANWADFIERRESTFGVPWVLQPIMRKLSDLEVIPSDAWIDAGEDTAWKWPEAFHMNPVEEANALNAWARSVVNVSRRNQFGNPVVSDEEARVRLGVPEKPKSGDTFPEAPQPTSGPQSGETPGTGATESPSQGRGDTSGSNKEAQPQSNTKSN